MPDIAFLNGEFLPLNQACLPVTDYGFLFGDALFETLRTYGGRFFRLEAHLDRLARSAALLEIPVDLTVLTGDILETARRSEFRDARLRCTLTPGSGKLVPDLTSCRAPTVLITAISHVPVPSAVYTTGWRAEISQICRDSHSLLPGLKTVSYLENLRARRSARSHGADEALFLNEQGCLTESSSANIFIFSDDRLQTPRVGCGVLPGVTRGVLLELATQLGIPWVETDLRPSELENATEAFLTNSFIEIVPLTGCDGKKINAGRPGPVTLALIQAYTGLVIRETARS